MQNKPKKRYKKGQLVHSFSVTRKQKEKLQRAREAKLHKHFINQLVVNQVNQQISPETRNSVLTQSNLVDGSRILDINQLSEEIENMS